MAVGVAVPPEVQDITQEVMGRVEAAGFRVEPAAADELGELVISGFRRLQERRVLDLPEDDPERQDLVGRALENLNAVVEDWMQIERSLRSSTLGVRSLARARANVCPVYPFR